MLLEIAQPVSLLLCLLSLFRVFYAAFLTPVSYWDQRIEPALGLLAVSAGICVVSGLIFREASLGAEVEGGVFGIDSAGAAFLLGGRRDGSAFSTGLVFADAYGFVSGCAQIVKCEKLKAGISPSVYKYYLLGWRLGCLHYALVVSSRIPI